MMRNKLVKNKTLNLSVFTVLLGLVTFAINPDLNYTISVIPQNTHAFLIAFGLMVVLSVGGIDLSSSYTVSFVSIVFAKLAEQNLLLGIVVSLVIGLIIGVMNGVLSWKTEIPYLVTLMTGFVLRGLAMSLSDGKSVIISMRTFSDEKMLWIACFILLAFGLCYKYTRFGRILYAIGDCKEAVWLETQVDMRYVSAYVLSSVLGAIAAIIASSRLGAASPLVGSGWEANAIAACIVAGCEFNGGTGEAKNVFISVLMFCLIKRILNYLSLPPESYWVVLGLIVLIYIEKPVKINIKYILRRMKKSEKS